MCFDGVFLLEDRQKIAHYPPNVNIRNLDMAFPLTTPAEGIPLDAFHSTIYVFNSGTSYFFTWAFRHNSKQCAIVIVTSSFCASLFIDFLNAVRSSFEGIESESDGLCRFGLVKSLLSAWKPLSETKITVVYPLESFILDLSSLQSWLLDFNVAPLYPYVDEVWKSLIFGERVVIVAPTPEIATSAVIAALSLFVPVKYGEPVLLYTDARDARVRNQRNKLIGTCDPKLTELEGATVIVIRGMDFDDMTDLQQTYRQKTHRYFTVMMNILNSVIVTNPYFDILETPVDVSRVTLPDDVDREVLVKMQRTETFREWRRSKANRAQVRTAFLSIPPSDAVKVVPPEKCGVVLAWLDSLVKQYATDEHFQSVLKSNIRLLTRVNEKRA